MNPTALAAFIAHAKSEYPRECCGLLLQVNGAQQYYPCINAAGDKTEEFSITPQQYAAAEDTGEVLAICHSHPDATTQPSARDTAMCNATGLPWHIFSWPEGDLRTINPLGHIPPLLHRPFVHGVQDCYALVRDWFMLTHNITLPDFPRQDGWWEGEQELYLENFMAAGFTEVPAHTIQPGDGILMQVQSKRVNHAAVYTGNSRIIHHLYGRPSCEGIYGGYWQERTRLVVRHKDLF